MPTLLWMPGVVVPFASLRLHATGYGGLLSETLNYVWAKQAMYEIEK